jgi:hypothetical protein
MQASQQASTNGHVAFAQPRGGMRSELDELRSTCRRQALVIDTLTVAISRLRTGASALKADNAELRAENQQMLTRQRAAG